MKEAIASLPQVCLKSNFIAENALCWHGHQTFSPNFDAETNQHFGLAFDLVTIKHSWLMLDDYLINNFNEISGIELNCPHSDNEQITKANDRNTGQSPTPNAFCSCTTGLNFKSVLCILL